ncbi:MAG: transglycosylase domain-containing protein [Acidobacteria bacterium]|nr:transglycosylase domain-containing protein [Acidobacteriota bacterium]
MAAVRPSLTTICPPHLIKAITVTEDRAFLNTMVSISVVSHVLFGGVTTAKRTRLVESGGSSITQQLIKKHGPDKRTDARAKGQRGNDVDHP